MHFFFISVYERVTFFDNNGWGFDHGAEPPTVNIVEYPTGNWLTAVERDRHEFLGFT